MKDKLYPGVQKGVSWVNKKNHKGLAPEANIYERPVKERRWEACRTGKFGPGMLECGAVEDISIKASE